MKQFLLTLFLFSQVTIFAQQERPVLTLKMNNGDVISGITDLSTISLKTAYGDLAFPIKEVSQITLGVSTAGVDKKEVFDQADRVQNYTLSEAAIAFDKLIKMEAGAVPLLREYIESPNYKKREGDLSVDLAYEVMLSRNHLKRNFSTKDLLQTTGATAIEGSYNFEALTLESDYGKISVARSKIQSIQISFKELNSVNSGNYKLEANRYISGNTNEGWLNTGILVHQGQTIKITANGEVHLASISNNAYTADGGVNGSPGAKGSELAYGSVVFRVGESGMVMKAGDTYIGKAAATGIIYLSIFESVYNAANTGFYNTKVSVE